MSIKSLIWSFFNGGNLIYLFYFLRMLSGIGAKFWNFSKNLGVSITEPFVNSRPSSEYSSETYIAYNAETTNV